MHLFEKLSINQKILLGSCIDDNLENLEVLEDLK